ncbi:hypothetical protein CspeluHIS016_0113710 [Cutaneotrichosporon spelunceum]|uniref:TPR domain protein n=1 Tax=Cutaneotrichosporon spelunceum TaxID=1672016 RepID=A0AAD3Y9A1_9TREE|nr:hypothetical protein CspeluHIS016_0113710 [Cutaneotrichosporon spelunceum]
MVVTMAATTDPLGLQPPDSYPYDLGAYSLPLSTSSPEAQVWFDRGLNWTYGFHHLEAARCFQYAIHCDPTCAMAFWGLAYATGPNYNKWWAMFSPEEIDEALPLAHAAAARAVGLAADALAKAKAEATETDKTGRVTRAAREKALCDALATRFPAPRGNAADFEAWNRAYIAAMADVHARFDGPDVATVYADAMMALAPWELWDLQTGAPRADSQTLRVKAVLDAALAVPGGMTHPGALHKYIHLMELSPTPEAALPAADALRDLVPDAGHLLHMPGHIDLLLGDYGRVITGADAAMAADDKYLTHGDAHDFYQFYTLHNASFTVYAAMFAGRLQPALAACDRMEAWLPDEFMRTPPIADWLEGFLTFRAHVLVRFGRWADILDLSFPTDRGFYSVTTTTLHYARALAFALTDRPEAAREEQARFVAARATIQSTRQAVPNTWSDIFDVAEQMLAGEMAYRANRKDEGFAHLDRAVALCDTLVYAEPWGWMVPPRHALGALLLEAGRVSDAAQVYADDLGITDTLPRALRHPKNVWALHGYHECLVRLGRAEACGVKRELDAALAGTDVVVESSCLCRRVG